MTRLSQRELSEVLRKNSHLSVKEQRPAKRPAIFVPQSLSDEVGGRSEHDEQVDLFNWASDNVDEYPDLAKMHAIPNGGHRYVSVAVKLKAEGVKAGTLDISLPVPRRTYHGMYIEMKVGKNKPTPEQQKRIDELRGDGYYVVVCYSAQAARNKLTWYLAG